MLTDRLAARTLTAGVLGLAPLALVAPAQAADTWTTSTVAEPSETVLQHGETFDVTIDVDSQSGQPPTGGTSTLYALQAGAGAWSPVASTTSPSGSFTDVRPRMNTTYKVVYAGYDEPDQARGDTYTSSESATFSIGVARRITHPTEGFTLKGRVTPKYAKKKVIVKASKRQEGGYRLVKALRTDRRGRYSYVLPKRRGTWYWLISVKGDRKYLGNSFAYETTVF